MLLIYDKSSPDLDRCTVLLIVPGCYTAEVRKNKLYCEGVREEACNNMAKADYMIVPDQWLPDQRYEEVDGEFMEIPYKLGELKLQHEPPPVIERPLGRCSRQRPPDE